jgi:hypothetical protein
VAPGLRRLLYAAAVLVFLAGVQLFVFPLRTARYFAWTVDPPMTAVFLGAAYWAAVGLEIGAARARTWSGARIAIPAVFVFTTATLILTLTHLSKFHLHDVPLSTLAVTWAWLAVYTVVPVLLVATFVAQRRLSTAVSKPGGLPAPVRVILVALAVLLLGFGLAMVVAPSWADRAWPWPLTPFTSGAIGAWLLGLGTAAAHACILNDRPDLRPLGYTGVAFGILQTIALVHYGDALHWGGPAAAYLAVLAVLTAVSVWALLPPRRRPRTRPASGGDEHQPLTVPELAQVLTGHSDRREGQLAPAKRSETYEGNSQMTTRIVSLALEGAAPVTRDGLSDDGQKESGSSMIGEGR